jgi:putative membrane protein
MQTKPFPRFLIRWLVNSLGLWIAAGFLGHNIDYGKSLGVIVIAGLVLAVVNTILKPMLVILALPALLLTLGLFMVIINGLTIYIVSKLYTPLHIHNFWAAVFAGLVIGLVNFLVTSILEDHRQARQG